MQLSRCDILLMTHWSLLHQRIQKRYFLLSIPKEIELNSLKGEISFIGYETLIVTPIPNDFKEYFLHPKSQLLEEITIISERKWLNMVPGGVEYNLKTLKLDEVGSALNAIGQLPRIIQEEEGYQ